MKGALFVMGALLAAAVAVAAWRGGWPLISEGFKRGGRESLTLLPLLGFVLVLTGFVQTLLPRELVSTWLSADAGWRGYGIAWIAGVVTPGGGPIGIPLAASLYKSGAGVGVVVTYLTSLSLLSFIRLPMEVALYGARLTALRVLVCVTLPPIAGVLADLVSPLVMGRR